MGWTTGDNAARFGLAAKYCPSRELELKAKVNNESKLAISATHYITDKVIIEQLVIFLTMIIPLFLL